MHVQTNTSYYRFAELETKLGEVDRGRAIYSHCSQMCDPRVAPEFWSAWKDFEVKHGNEDTVREMLRIKRSVQHTYNTQVNMMSAQMLATQVGQQTDNTANGDGANNAVAGGDSMKALDDASAAKPLGAASVAFVRGESQSKAVEEAAKEAVANPDEIDLDDDDDEDEEETEEVAPKAAIGGVEKQAVPLKVFGGLKKDDDDD